MVRRNNTARSRSWVRSTDSVKAPLEFAGEARMQGHLLDYIRLDYVRDVHGSWVTKPSEEPIEYDEEAYSDYSFTVLREWDFHGTNFTLTIQIKSLLLKTILQTIIGDIPGFSWNEIPLKIIPQTLLIFYPLMISHLSDLIAAGLLDDSGKHLQLLTDFLALEYRNTLNTIRNLLDYEEMTFDLMWCLLIPRTILYMRCPMSSEPRAAKLISAELERNHNGQRFWSISCQYTEASGGPKDVQPFGNSPLNALIRSFGGTVPISSLPVFPLKYHPDEQTISERLIERGRKWAALDGMHHKRYEGTAYSSLTDTPRVTVSGRIMIDKPTYKRMHPNDYMEEVQVFSDHESFKSGILSSMKLNEDSVIVELTEEQLLLASPLVHGFSMSDKMWLIFNINNVSEIEWQEDAFANLVLPQTQKSLIRSLVESHRGPSDKDGFDDFIVGKGRGLIINLFGPPGVGKTLSAEATSEYMQRPLYVVGVGEIGRDLEKKLKDIFDVASVWKAIVLIDEADVFMEQRSIHDLDRNALVAIFLRQLEYYQGILFLTTNRVKVFDEAFQSRIHISLHYRNLTPDAKKQIWGAFFKRAGMDVDLLTEEEWEALGAAKVNGRQIKNTVRSCQGLARSRQEAMNFSHIQEVLEVIEQFEADLKAQNDDPVDDPRDLSWSPFFKHMMNFITRQCGWLRVSTATFARGPHRRKEDI